MHASPRPAPGWSAGYCPTGHYTFSLLPDSLAARLSGTLAEVEAVVRAAEEAPPGVSMVAASPWEDVWEDGASPQLKSS